MLQIQRLDRRVAAAVLGVGLLAACPVADAAPPDPVAQNPEKLPAFPGAEGFGALATGGRGGEVVHVTNLNDSGPGSLREAVSQPDRTVVFDVAGVIPIASRLPVASNITIAGESAPAPGIAIYGNGVSFSGEQNIIVRHLRMRQGIDSSRGTKAVNVSDGHNMIFDHISAAWGRWDVMGITQHSTHITMQDSIFSEGIDPQRFGGLVDSSDGVTLARNLWSNNQSRNPKIKAHMQYFNNVIYNWGRGALPGGHSGADWHQDLINNLFIAGPSSDPDNVMFFFASTDNVYQDNNVVDTDKNGKLNYRPIAPNEYKGESPPTFHETPHNNPVVPTRVLSINEAYEHVLAQAGASLWRDAIDQRLIAQVRSLGAEGAIIETEETVGGQPAVEPTRHPEGYDTDRDGMPDTWERQHGLDPNDPADARQGDGYTNLERFLHDAASQR